MANEQSEFDTTKIDELFRLVAETAARERVAAVHMVSIIESHLLMAKVNLAALELEEADRLTAQSGKT